jgi:uncharacterized protein YprB with RNaseH-like and TPR domain
MSRLVFDIETIGEDFDALDEATRESLTRWIKRESSDEESYEAALTDVKAGLGFSPLTGSIVAIGVLDADRDRGVVYFDDNGTGEKEESEGNCAYKPMSEKEMLRNFWEGAKQYDEFVSFNGRTFDVPFLMVRSAVHGIQPTRDLMSNRYLNSQRGAKHIDLLDQLSFYGAVRRKGSLHLWCRAFGIKSPKEDGVTGDDVSTLFREGKYIDIAKYNAQDIRSTKLLYDKWDEYLRF